MITDDEQGMPPPEDSSAANNQNLFRTLNIIWIHRFKILRIVLIGGVLLSGIMLLIHNTYQAHATVMPDITTMSLADKLGSLQEMASAAGLNIGQTSPTELYPDIIMSETVLKKIIYDKYQTEKFDTTVNLIDFFQIDEKTENLRYEKCLTKLQKSVISVSLDKKTFMVEVDIETKEPKLSADIANNILDELDIFQRNFRKTNATEQRKFLEQRLDEVSRDMAKAEDNLKNFRETNRRVEQSAQLLLEQDRLTREVELNTALFIELKKQYEMVKLDEIKNTPVVLVLDTARVPAEKSGPHRTVTVLAGMVLLFLFASAWYSTKDYFTSNGNAPNVQQAKLFWSRMKSEGLFGRRRKS
ncbi:MAG: hypothetical protein ACHQQQ_00905 [Bacteroidota bacterium]